MKIDRKSFNNKQVAFRRAAEVRHRYKHRILELKELSDAIRCSLHAHSSTQACTDCERLARAVDVLSTIVVELADEIDQARGANP